MILQINQLLDLPSHLQVFVLLEFRIGIMEILIKYTDDARLPVNIWLKKSA